MPPPSSSARTVDANRSRPGGSAKYSGLIPSRSRASVSTPLSRSAIAKANMPLNRSTQPGPHLWNALMMTSLSALEKNR
jgi:hypothetical protein